MFDATVHNRASGWRAKIGIITPTVNTISEPEFHRMAPEGVTFHFSRMPIHRDPGADDYKELFDDLDCHGGALGECGLDAITYNCTVGSMACPADVLIPRLEAAGAAPAVATAGAVVAALEVLSVKRIAFASPYSDAVNAHEKKYLEARGFEVLASAGMEFDVNEVPGIGYARVPPETIYAHAKSVDRPEVEAIFISCANFGSAGIVDALEADIGKPVITTNTATCWASLRAAGIEDKIEGFGRLLAKH